MAKEHKAAELQTFPNHAPQPCSNSSYKDFMTTPFSSFITSDALSPEQDRAAALFQILQDGLEYGSKFAKTVIEHCPQGFNDPNECIKVKDTAFDVMETLYRDGLTAEGIDPTEFCTTWRSSANLGFGSVIKDFAASLSARTSEAA